MAKRLTPLYLLEFTASSVPQYCLPSFIACAKFLKGEEKLLCNIRASNATNYSRLLGSRGSSNESDDDNTIISTGSGPESATEDDDNLHKKQKATRSDDSCHVQHPKGNWQVTLSNNITHSSKEALEILGLNNSQSFMLDVTTTTKAATNVMALAFAPSGLPEGEMKKQVAMQMLAATGMTTTAATHVVTMLTADDTVTKPAQCTCAITRTTMQTCPILQEGNTPEQTSNNIGLLFAMFARLLVTKHIYATIVCNNTFVTAACLCTAMLSLVKQAKQSVSPATTNSISAAHIQAYKNVSLLLHCFTLVVL